MRPQLSIGKISQVDFTQKWNIMAKLLRLIAYEVNKYSKCNLKDRKTEVPLPIECKKITFIYMTIIFLIFVYFQTE